MLSAFRNRNARAVKDAEPCYIRRNGRTVAVLVSVREWRRRYGNGNAQTASNKEQERRIRAYQRKELHQLLKRHEQLLVKRAAAMQAMQ